MLPKGGQAPRLVAEPDHESIQVIVLGDRVPPHARRAVRYEVTGQEPVQEDIALQNGERPTSASVMTIAWKLSTTEGTAAGRMRSGHSRSGSCPTTSGSALARRNCSSILSPGGMVTGPSAVCTSTGFRVVLRSSPTTGSSRRISCALGTVLAPLLVEDGRAHLRPVDPARAKPGLVGGVRSPQDLPSNRERPNHPTRGELVYDALQVRPRMYAIRLKFPGCVTGGHDASLPRPLHVVLGYLPLPGGSVESGAQNMPLLLADVSGRIWRTSQCSTTLPAVSRRKMSMPA